MNLQSFTEAGRTVPQGTDHEEIRPEGVAVVFLTYRQNGHPCAACWRGRSTKTAWRFRFTSEEQRAAYIEGETKAQLAAAERKVATKRAASAYRHDYKVGDVLDSTWGYDQTNVDFYVVIATTDKTITIRKCGRNEAPLDGFNQERRVTPDTSTLVGESMRRTVRTGGYISITSYSVASRWDGGARSQTYTH